MAYVNRAAQRIRPMNTRICNNEQAFSTCWLLCITRHGERAGKQHQCCEWTTIVVNCVTQSNWIFSNWHTSVWFWFREHSAQYSCKIVFKMVRRWYDPKCHRLIIIYCVCFEHKNIHDSSGAFNDCNEKSIDLFQDYTTSSEMSDWNWMPRNAST